MRRGGTMSGIIAQLLEERENRRIPLKDIYYTALAATTQSSHQEKSLTKDQFFALQLKLKDKRGNIVPAVLNKPQFHFSMRRTKKDLVVKARQMGFTTLEQANFIEELVRGLKGLNFVSIADSAENTSHLIDIFDRFYNNLNSTIAPARRGKYPNPIRFPGRDSITYVGTAGNKTWGRAKTAHRVHCSETAYFPDALTLLNGLLDSVPWHIENVPVSALLESTANGAQGYFYELTQAALSGNSEWTAHFYAWWWLDEYRRALSRGEKIQYTTEEEKLITRVAKEGFNLTPEQIKWRRIMIQEKKDLFQQEFPESIQTAFLTSGRPRFNQEMLFSRLNSQCMKPIFEDYPIYSSSGREFNQLRIYKKVIPGRKYIIGADVAEGILISENTGATDNSTAIVRDVISNEQVATIQSKFSPFEYAIALSELAKYYNNALVAVERNSMGAAVLGHLIYGAGNALQPYPFIYEAEDGKPGWLTSVRTRPIMLDYLSDEIRIEDSLIIYDEAVVNEMIHFVINAKGKAEGSPGSWDDAVIASAIASYIRSSPYQMVSADQPYRVSINAGF